MVKQGFFPQKSPHIRASAHCHDGSVAAQLRPRYRPFPPISTEVIVMSGDPFQVHFHPKLGVVIYDPVAQMGLAREQMRLFKVGSMSSNTFMRGIVSKDLSACTGDPASQSADAVETYRTARSSRRKPYCEQCRRHFGSVDFTVCSDCSAIRCTCGTCSCVSSSRRRKAA
jgi:hypothetical protein